MMRTEIEIRRMRSRTRAQFMQAQAGIKARGEPAHASVVFSAMALADAALTWALAEPDGDFEQLISQLEFDKPCN